MMTKLFYSLHTRRTYKLLQSADVAMERNVRDKTRLEGEMWVFGVNFIDYVNYALVELTDIIWEKHVYCLYLFSMKLWKVFFLVKKNHTVCVHRYYGFTVRRRPNNKLLRKIFHFSYICDALIIPVRN